MVLLLDILLRLGIHAGCVDMPYVHNNGIALGIPLTGVGSILLGVFILVFVFGRMFTAPTLWSSLISRIRSGVPTKKIQNKANEGSEKGKNTEQNKQNKKNIEYVHILAWTGIGGGGLVNTLERIVTRHVTDYLHWFGFISFNIADVVILFGAMIILYDTFAKNEKNFQEVE